MLQRVIRTVLALCVATWSVTAGATTPPEHGIDARIEQAQRLFRAAERADEGPSKDSAYAAAERLAKQILETDPDNAEAHFLLFAAQGRQLMQHDGKPSLTNLWKYA